jgi:hypothetical protein
VDLALLLGRGCGRAPFEAPWTAADACQLWASTLVSVLKALLVVMHPLAHQDWGRTIHESIARLSFVMWSTSKPSIQQQ